jgi:hypothetical protein
MFLKVTAGKRFTRRFLNERETGVISRRFEVAAVYVIPRRVVSARRVA